jgi:hypothetical protein
MVVGISTILVQGTATASIDMSVTAPPPDSGMSVGRGWVIVSLEDSMSIGSTIAETINGDAPRAGMAFWSKWCKFQWYLDSEVSKFVLRVLFGASLYILARSPHGQGKTIDKN